MFSFFLTNCVQKNRSVSSANEPTQIQFKNTSDPVEAYNQQTTFQKCSDGSKYYLHQDILDMDRRQYLVRHESDWSKKIPIKCIQFAQQNYSGAFARCEYVGDSFVIKDVKKPCLTEIYTNFVYNAYHDVSECFNVDPRKTFLQIFIESGFHINAINKKGFDAGIGQFTRNGIQRVGHELINRVQRLLSESTSPSCERIASIIGKLQPDDFLKKNRCSVIAIPENPYRSLVMHYLHGLQDRIYFKDEFLEKRPYLKEIIDDEIIDQFVFLAYNRGITGTTTQIDNYIKGRRRARQTLTKEDFNLWQNLNEDLKKMKAEPEKREYLQNKRYGRSLVVRRMTFAEFLAINEKTYMAQMTAARDLVNSNFGPDTCFASQ
jgi:hypothetical protein